MHSHCHFLYHKPWMVETRQGHNKVLIVAKHLIWADNPVGAVDIFAASPMVNDGIPSLNNGVDHTTVPITRHTPSH